MASGDDEDVTVSEIFLTLINQKKEKIEAKYIFPFSYLDDCIYSLEIGAGESLSRDGVRNGNGVIPRLSTPKIDTH